MSHNRRWTQCIVGKYGRHKVLRMRLGLQAFQITALPEVVLRVGVFQ